MGKKEVISMKKNTHSILKTAQKCSKWDNGVETHNTKTIPQTLRSPGAFRGNGDYFVNLLHNLDEWFRWYSLLKWLKFCRYLVGDDGDKQSPWDTCLPVCGAANVNYEYLKLWIGFGSTKFSRVFRANAPVCARTHQVSPSWPHWCVYVNSAMQIYIAECEAICATRAPHTTLFQPTN